MIGLGMLANSGTMSFAGGKASSTNGDQTNGGLKTGGINMGGGGSFPFHLVLIAVLAVVVVIKLKG